MGKIDKNAYQEKRYDKSHLMLLAIFVGLLAIALVGGGVFLFVRGILVSGIWATIWRIALGVIMAILGLPLGYVAFMMAVTAGSMIKVKDGNVSDVGNSGMGTVNINKCSKCGEKLGEDVEFCTKCGAKVDGIVKCECGAKNSADDNYCRKCGKALK